MYLDELRPGKYFLFTKFRSNLYYKKTSKDTFIIVATKDSPITVSNYQHLCKHYALVEITVISCPIKERTKFFI